MIVHLFRNKAELIKTRNYSTGRLGRADSRKIGRLRRSTAGN